ncbi:MAG: DNA-protecting protein DprA [Deltaproteobacteria bacterium]|nr:DNA-protecting protein DprA [Deltaproteobacteria bacterium]
MAEQSCDWADWLTLGGVPGLGPVLCRRLLEQFGHPRAILTADLTALCAVPGVSSALAQALRAGSGKNLDAEVAQLQKAGLTLVPWTDPTYPRGLRVIPDPPPFLYVRGALMPEDWRAVAMVGSREASSYGLAAAERLAAELALRGITVVSGLARGIDAAAHRGALAVGGRTLAVLGCGLDRVYPAAHQDLAEAVRAQGALLGEFPPGTPPLPEHFPVRNRLISGLALGVIVVEAAERSGSLITARAALDQGREVFAVPGPITSATSHGTHWLLKQGAKLVEGVTDILEELTGVLGELPAPREDGRAEPGEAGGTPAEGAVLAVLGTDPTPIDLIVRGSGLSPAVASGALLQLELKGRVRQLSGKRFLKVA